MLRFGRPTVESDRVQEEEEEKEEEVEEEKGKEGKRNYSSADIRPIGLH